MSTDVYAVQERSLEMFFSNSVSSATRAAYGPPNEFRRNPPLRRCDGEQMPLAGHTLELVSAAVLELKP